MAGLVDIAPLSETVEIRGTQVEVTGLSAGGIATLLGRFPEIRKVMAGKEPDITELLGIGGEAVAAIIASGTGEGGIAEAERIAATLNVEEQVAILEAIIRVSLPGGIGPLVDRLSGLGAAVGVVVQSDTAPDTKSPRPSKR